MEASRGDPVEWELLDGLDHPGAEAHRCQQDGGALVCPPVQAWGWWAVKVLRALWERRHALERWAEMVRLRG